MKEAVENTQRYIVGCTDKYLKSSITLLEMLTAMDDVSKLTPKQVFVRLSSHPESLRLANRAICRFTALFSIDNYQLLWYTFSN